MPYDIRKKEGKFCVYKSDTDEEMHCYPKKADAVSYMRALYVHANEMNKPDELQVVLEASVEKTGREWEVTIIGAQAPGDVMKVGDKEYIVSDNGRLYDTAALAASVEAWDGVKVYDNHLTPKEFEEKMGMRSVSGEWLGTLVSPKWDKARKQLRAVFKVVEDRLAAKLKTAYEQGVLKTIGLSIDTAPIWGKDVYHEGELYPVIEGFKRILSVDVVADPAAGGRFERLLASKIKETNIMSDDAEKEMLTLSREDLEELISAKTQDAVDAALAAAKEAEAETIDEDELDKLDDEEAIEALAKHKDAKTRKDISKAEIELKKLQKQAQETQYQADLARTELMIEHKLEKANMPEKFEEVIRMQFAGQKVDAAKIDEAIKTLKEAKASVDPSGRVNAGGHHDIVVGIVDDERFELEFYRMLMGNRDFRELEHSKDEAVMDLLKTAPAYKSWINSGKPDLPQYRSISHLLYDYFGGDPLFNARAMEAATTSSLTTVVKNTVNIMTANSYSVRERWFDPIVRTEEVDTIDQATLARVYGVNTLSTVNEGAAYTELQMADEEETASFVKRGNYIGITLEVLMSDKINFVRRIPQVLADTWYNTQSALVSAVFTVNTATGPILADSGALFNATAIGTPGGHVNLLTTALSHSEFGVVRTAMRKQTDQPLGAGRRLLLNPKYLLVPVDLEVTALDIRNSEYVPAQSGGATTGGQFQTVNNYRNQFEVIVVPDWTDTNNWAVVADPATAPAIWLIYPRGQRTPQIFSADSETSGAMFTNDELRFKVRMMTYRYSSTYDCAPVSDFRPLHKSNV